MNLVKVTVRRLGPTVAAIALLAAVVGCTASGQTLAPSSTVVATPAGTAVQPTSGSGIAATTAPTLAPPSGSGRAVPAAAVAQSAPAASQPAPAIATSAQPLPPVATPNPSLVHGIVVTGTGQVQVKPDQAVVTAGVRSRASTAQEAQADNNAAMQKVIDAIKGLGIPAEDIQTSGISLYPITNENQLVTGYSASNNVTVTVENVEQAGAVLDAATKAGANVEGNVRFQLKDPAEARNQALAAAAADAKSKANALAAAMGLKITGVQSISEGSVSSPVIYEPRAAQAASTASVPVEPGQLNVTAQVTIVFGY